MVVGRHSSAEDYINIEADIDKIEDDLNDIKNNLNKLKLETNDPDIHKLIDYINNMLEDGIVNRFNIKEEPYNHITIEIKKLVNKYNIDDKDINMTINHLISNDVSKLNSDYKALKKKIELIRKGNVSGVLSALCLLLIAFLIAYILMRRDQRALNW